ncbi:protein of unknown function [Paraburkholderia kururiensis]
MTRPWIWLVEARAISGPVFKTTKEATAATEALGFKRISEAVKDQAVYQDGKHFIATDIDEHKLRRLIMLKL